MDSLAYKDIVLAAIAVVSLIVSLVSLHRTGRLQRQQMKLQEKQEQLVERQLAPRADVRVSLSHQNGRFYFGLRNEGEGLARRVDLELKDSAGLRFRRDDLRERLPIPEMGPGQETRLFADLKGVGPLRFAAAWRWTDADGTRQDRSAALST